MQKIGRYHPIAFLGKGGMATVYLAVAAGPAATRKLLVVKQVRSELSTDERIVEMFLNEARLATVLNHPNVVQTYEVLQTDDGCSLVMEYVEGQSLGAIRGRGYLPELPLDTKVAIVAQMLSALHYAHEANDLDGQPLGIVHRDVSPQNVIVSYDGHVKLMDFGVAKVNNSSIQTEFGEFKGKVAYAAPEQLIGKVDRRTDVFAAGIVLSELVTGKRFWGKSSDLEVVGRLTSDAIPRASASGVAMPEALAKMIDRATCADPANRFSTALEFLTEIEAYGATREGPPDLRALGEFLRTKFDAERREIKATIEARTRELPDDTASVPSLAKISVPDLAQLAGSKDAATQAVAEPAPPRSRRARWVAAAGLVAAFGVVALAARVTSSTSASPVALVQAAEPVAAAAPAPAASPPVASAAQAIEVTLVATPKSAQLFFDGKPLESNPARVSVAPDGAVHDVRASEHGVSVSKSVRLAANETVALTVARPTPGRRATSKERGAQATATAPAEAEPMKAAATRPAGGHLEEVDPYR